MTTDFFLHLIQTIHILQESVGFSWPSLVDFSNDDGSQMITKKKNVYIFIKTSARPINTKKKKCSQYYYTCAAGSENNEIVLCDGVCICNGICSSWEPTSFIQILADTVQRGKCGFDSRYSGSIIIIIISIDNIIYMFTYKIRNT